MTRLKGKVALVTGAGGGIGAATAQRFAQEGAIVAVNDYVEEAGNKVVAAIREAGGTAQFYGGSVADSAAVKATIKDIVERFGKIDILINNAGVTRDSLSYKMTEEQWDTVVDIHLKGAWLTSINAFEYMRQQNSGRIVNTSSVSALGNIGQANYAAAKAGIWGLTKTLALEYSRYNILVNAIAPGYISTPMTAVIPQNVQDAVVSRVPLKRMGKPEEIANMHLFLSSDESSYITGQIFFVDGGVSVGV
jgi:3-oxoacyl-[acyl-carrier protein] reductase